MENSTYVPSPIPHPALVVFSQAGGLPEALRMQRPFNPQGPEAKDLHIPFSVNSFGIRPMDYPGLPAHLLNLQSPFLHPGLDHRMPFGGGAFHPLNATEERNVKNFPSAFAPPSKCPKIETGAHEGANLSVFSATSMAAAEDRFVNGQRNDSSSPSSVSPLHVKEESSDTHISEDREGTGTPGSETGTERSTPEEGRGIRRKKLVLDPSCCPVCGVTVRPGELECHFALELDKLVKLSVVRSKRPAKDGYTQPKCFPGPSTSRREAGVLGEPSLEARWETYQRIRANRQSRLRVKSKKKKPDEAMCPVCNAKVQGTMEELNAHVELCLRKHGTAEEDHDVDIEGDGEIFEEYEWAGQKRIRTSTLLEGGFAGVGLQTSSSKHVPEDEDCDLVVDGDDSATYGPPQYTQADIIVCSADEPTEEQERVALREAIIRSDCTRHSSPVLRGGELHPEMVEEGSSRADSLSGERPSPIMNALKARIRELEHENKVTREQFRCLICMSSYKKPLASVSCWHVHCEQCWMQALGAKKLCPQCNMITSPSDLRKIFL